MESLKIFRRSIGDLFSYISKEDLFCNCNESFCTRICYRLVNYLNSILEYREYSIIDGDDSINLKVSDYETMIVWDSFYPSWKSLAIELISVKYYNITILECGGVVDRKLGKNLFYRKRSYLKNSKAFDLFSTEEFIKIGIFGYYRSMVIDRIIGECFENIANFSTVGEFTLYIESVLVSRLASSGEHGILSWLMGYDNSDNCKNISYDLVNSFVRLFNVYSKLDYKCIKLFCVEDYINLTIDGSLRCSVYTNGKIRIGSRGSADRLIGIIEALGSLDFIVDSLSYYKSSRPLGLVFKNNSGSAYDVVIG